MEAEQTQKNFKEKLIAAATGSTPPPSEGKMGGIEHRKNIYAHKERKVKINFGLWWWSCGQRARVLLWRSEFECRWWENKQKRDRVWVILKNWIKNFDFNFWKSENFV